MQETNIKQQIAASPNHSVWVDASAGTGKTKVLTDRVLRLLISETPFNKILCLTFTNAAASEMTSRISKSLMEWEHNTDSLERLLGRKPNPSEIVYAKNLFANLMLSAEQLSIHTIHSFCQKILQRFPFEAGIIPGFKVLSETETESLCENVINDLSNIIGAKENPIREVLSYMLKNIHESTFNDIISEIISNQMYFRELFNSFSSREEYIKFLKSKTNTSYHEEFYIEEFAHKMNSHIYEELIDKEQKIIDGYNLYCLLSLDDKIKKFRQFKKLFLTEKDEPRKTLLYKNSKTLYPELETKLRNIQSEIYKCDQKAKISRMIIASGYIFEIANYVICKYASYKSSMGSLDYDDLIYYTKELLTKSEIKEWVLYKLDGGVKHLLVDEAQDTSPEQWQIIEAIMSEFYSGDTANVGERTVFIVGDEKQSIYSFQGADVSNFLKFNNYIKEKMELAEKDFKNIDLEWSYRSSPAILEVVAAFLKNTLHSELKPYKLKCFREKHNGLVELWPLYNDQRAPQDLFWPLLDDYKTEQNSSTILANDIAKFIKTYIDSGTIIPSTGKPARPEDFMILIRRRNEFTHEIIHALKEHKVEVGGIDRIVIMDHLSIKDIISIAKFTMLPEDDLNLACLLRSPIISISDEKLEKLALEKKDSSLFSQIEKYEIEIAKILSHFIELSQKLNISKFFHTIIDIMGARQILIEANGASSDDAIDELLYLAFQFEKQHNSNIQEFLYWIERHEIEVKRDVGTSENVKIITVHGAKGLESPVVILADTTSMPIRQSNFLWNQGILYWLGSLQNSNNIYEAQKEILSEGDYQEYLRLLYVALTRAEDHLIVAGFATTDKISDKCWYREVEKAIKTTDFTIENEIIYHGNHKILLCKTAKEIYAPIIDFVEKEKRNNLILIKSLKKPYKRNKSPLESRSPLTYGQILHKILEDSIKTGNFAFNPSHPFIELLPQEFKASMIEKLSTLFNMKEFKELTNYEKLQTEVAVGYDVEGTLKTGRIDLMAMSENEIIIIDYKNDLLPPESIEKAPSHYITQLKLYKDSIEKIIPGKHITTKILWLENLHFMSC